jgi:hypothetical protein
LYPENPHPLPITYTPSPLNLNKRKGTSIIFVNDKKQVLLLLRDDKPGIPYPNMWDVLSRMLHEFEMIICKALKDAAVVIYCKSLITKQMIISGSPEE